MSRVPVGAQHVEVDGRRVRLTNLDRVLWPSTGMTKWDMLEYYVRVAPWMLPHVRRRPLTLWRYPEGVESEGWWQNECRGAPDWVARYEYDAADGRHHRHCMADDVPSLLWIANQGTIELHPFLFQAERPKTPLVVVFDLDPGDPASLADACRVGIRLHGLLESIDLRSFAKASGSKGLHVVVPLNEPHTFEEMKAFARTVARLLVHELPVVVDRQARALRAGKVLVDWLQNDPFRSTVAPYSLRATSRPTVSMPINWGEVERACAGNADQLLPQPADAIERLEQDGDAFADVLQVRQRLPGSELGG